MAFYFWVPFRALFALWLSSPPELWLFSPFLGSPGLSRSLWRPPRSLVFSSNIYYIYNPFRSPLCPQRTLVLINDFLGLYNIYILHLRTFSSRTSSRDSRSFQNLSTSDYLYVLLRSLSYLQRTLVLFMNLFLAIFLRV